MYIDIDAYSTHIAVYKAYVNVYVLMLVHPFRNLHPLLHQNLQPASLREKGKG